MTKLKITGWVLSGLLAALFILASASAKLTEWEGKAEEFAKVGFSPEVMFAIGIVEVTITLLFLIPRTSFIGAILLSAYLGGAVVTHVRVGEPFFVPIIIGVVVWVALGFRRREIFRLAVGAKPSISEGE